MSTDGYLRRFIDLEYKLEKPDTRKYANVLFSTFRIQEAPGFKDWDQSIFRLSFVYLAEIFQLSLRDQEQCLILLNVILRTARDREIRLHLILFLLMLKFFDDSIYDKFLSQNIMPEDIFSLLDQELLENKYSNISNHLDLIEYYVSVHLLNEASFNSYVENYRKIKTNDLDPIAKGKANFILEMCRRESHGAFKSHIFPTQIKLIELAQKFSIPA